MKKLTPILLLLVAHTVIAEPPEWAKNATWYQIFVERFHNGDSSNDPRMKDIQGSYPGFIPKDWETSKWTSDWYQPDAYFESMHSGHDFLGNPVTSFDQKTALRRYGGDLQGVLDKLDYIEQLGVTAIYFNPLNDAPSLHKYDARHWRHIDRTFGPNPDADIAIMASENPVDPSTWQLTHADQLFLNVIEEAHKRNIRVILDYSFNHTGHTFWAWQDVRQKQQESIYSDWYWIKSFDDPATSENEFDYQGWFNVYDLPEIRETEYIDHSDSIVPAEGNILNPAAKQHIFNVTQRWLDPNGDGDPSDGVDGFRLDVAAEVPFGFWREYRTFVKSINPDAYLVGEVWWEKWPDQLLDPAPFLQGDVFDSVMNYRWYRSARSLFSRAARRISVSEFVTQLKQQDSTVETPYRYAMMNMSASHDTPRLLTSFANSGKYKVNTKAAQDPNYVIGNPDRATHEDTLLFLIHQFTYVGAPQIWAGDEMGMWGSDDPHTRKPLIWPEFKFDDERHHPTNLARASDKVVFNHQRHSVYQTLANIRNAAPALRQGSLAWIFADDEHDLLGYVRELGEQKIAIIFNLSEQDRLKKIEFSSSQILLAHNGATISANQLSLPARSAIILEVSDR